MSQVLSGAIPPHPTHQPQLHQRQEGGVGGSYCTSLVPTLGFQGSRFSRHQDETWKQGPKKSPGGFCGA